MKDIERLSRSKTLEVEQTVNDKLLTVDDLAGYLQLSTKTIYRMLRRGQLPCYRVGNQWRFRKSTIDAWLEQERETVAAGGGA